ncbi:MAG: hypothetical protein WCR74_07115 [Betaproteobacteria bacterium]
MDLIIPMHWVGFIALPTLFTVMFAIGLMLGPQQIAAAMTRRTVLLAVLFAAVVPVPVLTVLALEYFGLRGPVAVGLLLMAISPGAPFALKRAIDAGGHREFAPALHVTIVVLAVVTVPLSVAILSHMYATKFQVTYFQIGKQVFFAQLLPLLLGALFHYLRPAAAAWLQPRMARAGNYLAMLFSLVMAIDIVPVLGGIGFVPTLAGCGLSVLALATGALFVGRDSEVRSVAAIAVAMRNPGLAMVMANANHAPPAVTATIMGYTLGVALVVTVFLWWQKRRSGTTGL